MNIKSEKLEQLKCCSKCINNCVYTNPTMSKAKKESYGSKVLPCFCGGGIEVVIWRTQNER